MAATVIPSGGSSKPMSMKAQNTQGVSWNSAKQKTAQTSWTANENCTVVAVMAIEGTTSYFSEIRRKFTINNVEFSGNYIVKVSKEYVAYAGVKKGDVVSVLYEANCGSSAGTIRVEIHSNS